MNILYEDNHLLVLNKPADLLTQPSGTDRVSLESQAKEFIKKRDKKPGNVYLHAVHRLDRVASGIVVFAKTSKALSRLQTAIQKRQCRKIYLAWVEREFGKESDTLEHWLLHDNFRSKVVTEKTPKAKHARLSFKVVKRSRGNTLVQIELETGRYHQIRCQFAAIGHPILGDVKYGAKEKHDPGIALQHSEFEVEHPVTKKRLKFFGESKLSCI